MMISLFFFFNDTATTEIYTLSLHDALPISTIHHSRSSNLPSGNTSSTNGTANATTGIPSNVAIQAMYSPPGRDRKSTRLNSSHANISYAVFCLKKKKKTNKKKDSRVNCNHI